MVKWLRIRRLQATLKKITDAEASIIPPALTIIVATILSKVLGMGRNVLFASTFGTDPVVDTFFVAIQFPDFLTGVFILGAFTSAFIPVFARYLEEGKEKTAWKIADAATTLLFLIIICLSLVLFIFAPLVISVMTNYEGEQFNMTVTFLRIMLLSPVLLGISNVLSSVLKSHHKFTASAFAPLFYNAGIIVGLVAFVPSLGAVWGLGLGVVLGAFLHAAIQIIPAMRLGYRWHFNANFDLPGIRQIVQLSIPRMIGMGVAQIDLFVDNYLAVRLTEGSVAMLRYANTVQNLPVGVFGVALATASFPLMVRKAAQKTTQAFQGEVFKQLGWVMYFTLPMAVAFIILRVEIVRVLFGQGGAISWTETREIAFALSLYAISVTAQAAIYLLNRAFFALQDTKTPVIAAVISVISNTALSFLLVFVNRHFSMLALSFTIASWLNLLLLMVFLYGKMGAKLDWGEFPRTAVSVTAATLVMGSFLFLLENWLSNSVFDLTQVPDLMAVTAICVTVSGVLYLALAEFFGANVLFRFIRMFKQRVSS